jgi:gas vesicle protein
MVNENQELETHSNSIFGVLAGLLVGGLAGATAMWLMAPQSGRDTRIQIQKKGIKLRDRTTKMMDDTMGQVRSKANTITIGGRKKIKELKKHGQELAVEQLDRVSKAAHAGKKAIQRS